MAVQLQHRRTARIEGDRGKPYHTRRQLARAVEASAALSGGIVDHTGEAAVRQVQDNPAEGGPVQKVGGDLEFVEPAWLAVDRQLRGC